MQSIIISLLLLMLINIFVSPGLTFAQNDPTTTQTESLTDDNQTPETEEGLNQMTSGSVDVASIFWPIVPGTTVADGTFFLKQIKEALTGMMKFGNINKANYYTELSEKRIVEANKLIEDKDYPNALKSLKMSEDMRKNAIASKKKAVEAKEDTLELINRMVASFEKQKQVLQFFSLAVPADQKAEVDEDIKNIELQISEAK